MNKTDIIHINDLVLVVGRYIQLALVLTSFCMVIRLSPLITAHKGIIKTCKYLLYPVTNSPFQSTLNKRMMLSN